MQTRKFWLEWDIRQDTLQVSENWFAHFHFQPSLVGQVQDLPDSHRRSPSAAQIAEIRSQLQRGNLVPTVDLSLECGKEGIRWYRLELTLEKDAQGEPVRVLGLLSDMDQQRRELQWLRHLAHQDCLTGLYNRFKIQQLIEEALRQAPVGKSMTLAVMDIDNFKQINDAYGHDCGDETLRRTAAEIRALFAPEDLVGRIGGVNSSFYCRKQAHAIRSAARSGSHSPAAAASASGAGCAAENFLQYWLRLLSRAGNDVPAIIPESRRGDVSGQAPGEKQLRLLLMRFHISFYFAVSDLFFTSSFNSVRLPFVLRIGVV